jgi:hypothetical protein
MKMFKGILVTAMLAASSLANAGTAFNFSPATDGSYMCGNYCVGYVTDEVGGVDSVDFTGLSIVSPFSRDLKLTIQINGVYYVGILPSGDGSVPFVVSNVSGPYALVTVNYTSRTTCTHSGRGQHCTTWRSVSSGSVNLT